MMLPLELAIAEPGSGKTQFYNLRKTLWSGNASLDAMPQDIRDWNASIANSDGMWVGENSGSWHPNAATGGPGGWAARTTGNDQPVNRGRCTTNARNLALKSIRPFA